MHNFCPMHWLGSNNTPQVGKKQNSGQVFPNRISAELHLHLLSLFGSVLQCKFMTCRVSRLLKASYISCILPLARGSAVLVGDCMLTCSCIHAVYDTKKHNRAARYSKTATRLCLHPCLYMHSWWWLNIHGRMQGDGKSKSSNQQVTADNNVSKRRGSFISPVTESSQMATIE